MKPKNQAGGVECTQCGWTGPAVTKQCPKCKGYTLKPQAITEPKSGKNRIDD